jgi:hypothetical protein
VVELGILFRHLRGQNEEKAKNLSLKLISAATKLMMKKKNYYETEIIKTAVIWSIAPCIQHQEGA